MDKEKIYDLAMARAQERNDTIEICARLVETHPSAQMAVWDDWAVKVGTRIAAQIRELKHK